MACSIGMNILIIMLPVPPTMSVWPGSHWWTGLGSYTARETPCYNLLGAPFLPSLASAATTGVRLPSLLTASHVLDSQHSLDSFIFHLTIHSLIY